MLVKFFFPWHSSFIYCQCLTEKLCGAQKCEEIDERVLYVDWQMCGESSKMCEKWMQLIITKVLINTRWRLNQLIDGNMGKPANVHPEHWKTLVAMRATEATQAKYEHMHSTSGGNGSTIVQMKAIEREVVSRLVSLMACMR